MLHVPITNPEEHINFVKFTHINRDAKKDDWIKENMMCLNHFKINIFMEGDFSVVIKDKRCNPVYGDLCIMPPNTMHYGLIPKPTHTDYYQLDIGATALNNIPGGDELLLQLEKNANTIGHFIRPDKATSDKLIQICRKTEGYVADKDFAPAFIYVAEMVYIMNSLYKNQTGAIMQVLSLHTKNAINYIENNYASQFNVADLARHCRVSASYLSRCFKKEVGITIHSYINNYRILKAVDLLKSNSVTQTTYMCGFSDSSHFISVFKKALGITPAEYKKHNKSNQ